MQTLVQMGACFAEYGAEVHGIVTHNTASSILYRCNIFRLTPWLTMHDKPVRNNWRVGCAARVEVPIWPTGTLTLVALGDSGLPCLEALKGLAGANATS